MMPIWKVTFAGILIGNLRWPSGKLNRLSGWIDMLKRKDFYGALAAQYPYVEQFVARAERDIRRSKSIIQELRTDLRRQAPAPVILQVAVADAEQLRVVGAHVDVAVRQDHAVRDRHLAGGAAQADLPHAARRRQDLVH